MLVKANLQNQIKSALEEAMKTAMKNVLEKGQESVTGDGDKITVKEVSIDDIAKAFAEGASSCAGEIATAIHDYITSADVMLNAGTTLTPAPGSLSCAVGPVAGSIVLISPTLLSGAIK